MKLVIATVGILAGLATGFFVFADHNSNDQLEVNSAEKIEALQQQLGEAESQLTQAKARAGRLESAKKMHQGDLLAANKKIALLEKNLKTATEISEQPVASVDDSSKTADLAQRLKEAKLVAAKLSKTTFPSILAPKKFAELVDTIKALGDEGVDMALAMLDGENKEERLLAVQLLGMLDDARVPDALADAAIAPEDADLAAWASQSLMKLDGKGAINAMKNTIANSPHEGARVNSMWGLLRTGDKESFEQARAYLNDEKNTQAMRRALEGGLFLVNHSDVRPLIDDFLSRVSGPRKTAIMGEAIKWYGRNIDVVNRQRLNAASNDPNLSEALRQQARDVLAGL
ncbi:MAG: hypothetical protein V3W41_09450 [Planctomycetota bacterium]